MHQSKIKVLYIAGFERSGSTILNRVLGQIDGFVAWGELRDIWQHGIAENRHCTCGALFADCSAWQKIFNEAFNGIEQIDTEEISRLQKKTRSMVLPHYFGLLEDKVFKKRTSPYLNKLEKLYHTIQTTTDSKVIVDSTKASWYGYALGLLPSIDLYIVHIVRDPKGVCYSLEQRKCQGELESQWYNPLHASLSWNLKNYGVETLLSSSPERYLRINYESFMQTPQTIIKQILNLIGEEVTELPFTDRSTVKMSMDHIVTGSPSSRSDLGTVKLKLDERWKKDMKSIDRSIVNMFTFALQEKYYNNRQEPSQL